MGNQTAPQITTSFVEFYQSPSEPKSHGPISTRDLHRKSLRTRETLAVAPSRAECVTVRDRLICARASPEKPHVRAVHGPPPVPPPPVPVRHTPRRPPPTDRDSYQPARQHGAVQSGGSRSRPRWSLPDAAGARLQREAAGGADRAESGVTRAGNIPAYRET